MATMMRSLGLSIFSRYDGSGVTSARRDIDSFSGSVNRSTSAMNSWNGRIILAAKSIAVFGPALLPIAANLTAIAGAATAMAASVGTALGAYGLAVKNAIDTTNGMAKAGKELTAVQKEYLKVQMDFQKATVKFGESFRDETLKAVTATLKGLTTALKGLEPVAKAIAPEVTKVAQAFEKWTKGDSFKNYVNLIKASAVPAFRDLVAAGKDFLNVVGDGFRAFLPHGIKLAQTIREGAAALKQWSDGGGFQKFLAYVKETSPQVKEFFQTLWDAFKNIMQAMKDLAPLSLLLVTSILKLVAALPPEWITAIVQGFVAFKVAMLGLMVIKGLISIFMAVKAAWFILSLAFGATPLGWVVIAVMAVIAAFILLIKNWDTVSAALKTAWNATWNALKTAANAVWNALKTAWNAVVNAFKTAWNAVSSALTTAWNAVWNALKTAAQAVWDAIKTAWNAVVNAFQTAWNAVSSALTTAWNAVWNALKTAAQAVWDALKTAWNAVVNAFKTAWDAVSSALKTAWDTVWNALKTAAQAVWDALKTAWNAVVNALKTAWDTVSSALKTAWDTVWNALKTAAQAVWDAIKTAWNAVVNAFKTAWDAVSAALKTAWDTVWNALKTAAQAVWDALKTAWDAVLNALKIAWDTVSAALKTAWDTVWNALKTAAQAVWDALKTAWDAVLNALKIAWDTVSAALKTAWDTVWNAIKTAAQAVWDALKTAWDAVLNALKTAWDTVSAALKTAWDTVWNAIKTAAQAVWDAIKQAWQAFLDAVKQVWETVSNALKEAWNTFWDFLKTEADKRWKQAQALWTVFLNEVNKIWGTTSAALKNAWESTWNFLKDVATKVWRAIGGVIEKAVHGVIDVINGLIGGFNNVTSFLKIDVKIGKIDKPKFPGLADGGVVTFAYGGMTGGPKDMTGGGSLRGFAPGRDTIPAILSRGEGVLTPEAVRGLGGPGFVDSANRTYAGHRGAGNGAPKLQGFARGGMIPPGVKARPCNGHGYSHGGMVGGMVPFAVGGMTAAALKKAGVPLSMVTQGEHSDGALSGGTHLGGGAVDIASTSQDVLSRLKSAGFAAWVRGPADGMSPHIHAVLMNHPDLSPQARAQVSSFKAGGSGLGVGGGGGGAGVDIMGMIAPHIGKILLNVYRGMGALSGIGGTLASMFGGGNSPSREAEKNPIPDDLMARAERGDKAAIDELAKRASEGVLDRSGIIVQPAPFTGRPPVGAPKQTAKQAQPNSNANDFSALLGRLAEFVLPALTREHIATGLSDAKKGLGGLGATGGGMGQIAAGFGKKLIDEVIPDFLLKKAAAATPPAVSFGGGGNTQKWAPLASKALGLAGLSSSQLPKFLALMQKESGGNPSAINNTDSNARAGDHSRGLMQVTGSTFARFRDPKLPNNILDPLANMVAAARYIKSRYGGQVPGSPYAAGTTSATPGLHLVGEQGPELVTSSGYANFAGGETVYNAADTAALMSTPTTPGSGIEASMKNRSFEEIIAAAKRMAAAVKVSWNSVVTASTFGWTGLKPVLGEVSATHGVQVPTSIEAMRAKNVAAWMDMNLQSAMQWALMRDTTLAEAQMQQGTMMPLATTTMQTASNTAWTDMNLQSTTQWGLMRDTTFAESGLMQTETMPLASTTMQTANSTAWSDMNLQSSTEWGLMRDGTYAESGLMQTETMPMASMAMSTASDSAWTGMQATADSSWTAMDESAFTPFGSTMTTDIPGAAETMQTEVSTESEIMSTNVISDVNATVPKVEQLITTMGKAIETANKLTSMTPGGGSGGSGGLWTGGWINPYGEQADELLGEAKPPPPGGTAWSRDTQHPEGRTPFTDSVYEAMGFQLVEDGSWVGPNFFRTRAEMMGTGGDDYASQLEAENYYKKYGTGSPSPFDQDAAEAYYLKYGTGGPLAGYATGTSSASPGLALVGERGPELLNFHGGESVTPAPETAKILAGLAAGPAMPEIPGSTLPGDGKLTPPAALEQIRRMGNTSEDEGWFGGIIAGSDHMMAAAQAAWDNTVAAGSAAQPVITATTDAIGREMGVTVPSRLEVMSESSLTNWTAMNTQSAAQWATMRDTTFAEAELHQGTTMPTVASTMQTAHDLAWTTMNATSLAQWTIMRDTTFADSELHQGTTMPEMSVTMQTAHDLAWTTMNATSSEQWTIMRDTQYLEAETHLGTTMPEMSVTMQTAHDLAWTTMNATSLAQWTIMRDTQYLEAETHLGTTMPEKSVAMQTAHDLAWTTMNATSATEWTAIRDNQIVPFETHMGETMPTAAQTMQTAVSEAFTAMVATVVQELDSAIAKIDEFIAKTEAAIAAAEKLKAAQAAAAASGGGGGGGNPQPGMDGGSDLDAALARAGNPTIIQGPYSDGALSAGTHMGGGVVDVPVSAFDAMIAAGFIGWIRNWPGNEHAHMILPGVSDLSPAAQRQVDDYYAGGDGLGVAARGTNHATAGWTWVGEKGPELMRMHGGEQVMPHEESLRFAASMRSWAGRGFGGFGSRATNRFRSLAAEQAASVTGGVRHCDDGGIKIEFNFNGPVSNGDDVRQAVNEAIPKIRTALQAGSGRRIGG